MSKAQIGCCLLLVLGMLGLGLLGVGKAVGVRNQLIALEEGVNSAWAQVENVYQRRADLIPNLVATVKGARDFEQETLRQVTEARAKVGQVQISGIPDAAAFAKFEAAQSGLSSALSRLMVVAERYPELQATQAFRDLQAQLEGSENRITVERKRFNDAVREYNSEIRAFPASWIAGFSGLDQRPYFEASPGSDQPPTVEF